MIRSNLCDYSDAYIKIKGTTTVPNTAGVDAAVSNTNKKVIFRNCVQFTNCISKMNNTEVDNTQDIDFVMLMYNLIEYSDVCSKTSGSLWQYYRDEPALDNNNNIIDFHSDDDNSISFKLKQQVNSKWWHKKC